MASLVNNCVFIAASGGTGAFTVDTAAAGHEVPVDCGVVDTTKTYRYRAQSSDKSEWEEGDTVASSTATSFTRVVSASSAGGTTTVNFTNPPTVALTMKAEDVLQFDDAMSLTSGQKTQARSNIDAAQAFPSGTAMLFQQTTAPTGWTKSTTHNDKALRVVSGSASSGGTNAFSTVMAQTVVGSTSLSTAQLASHTHTQHGNSSYAATAVVGSCPGTRMEVVANGGYATGSAGSGSSHDHTITMAMQYVDVIIATKD